MLKNVVALMVMFAILVTTGAISCQYRTEKKAPKTSGLPMKVAKYYWPGIYWIEIADKKGWFNEAGLNVELVDTNPDYFASLDDMVAGKMDANTFSLFDLISYNLKGAELVMVINSDNSCGAEAIVAKKNIEDIRSLKGKRVGVAQGTYLEYILEQVLARNGLEETDVIKVNGMPEKCHEDFISGELDAVITWEPLVTEAIQKGEGRNLFDTSEIPGISPNGIAFHRSFIEQRRDDVQAFVGVWHRATAFIKENPEEAFGIITKIYQKTPAETQSLAQTDKLQDLQDNLDSFLYSTGFESLHGAVRYLNNFMIKHKRTDKLIDSTEYLDPRFVRALVQEKSGLEANGRWRMTEERQEAEGRDEG